MEGRSLWVDVPFSEEDGRQWPDSLAGVVDDMRVGLPAEYVAVILDALSAAGARILPPGTIRVVEAAHGLVGSSPSFFGKLACCIVELMHDARHHEDREMAAFLTRRLVR
ncbi:MAG: hypothetical protein H0T46_34945 [Deltaproteobacteria bacterium]|nr:hypothetical protein [Deltaproteobacteria bacterium]